MDVDTEAISVAVRLSAGKVIMESILETKAEYHSGVPPGAARNVHVTFEEGTWAAWLYDLLKPHVTKVWCATRGRMLAEGREQRRQERRTQTVRTAAPQPFKPVYHGEHGIRALKELSRSYRRSAKISDAS